MGLITAARDEFLTKWQEYMYDKSYQDQIAFWNNQNEYNNPSAQRDRLESAGLNSAAVMSSGVSNTSSGSASGSTPGTPGAAPSPDIGNQLGQMANLAHVFAQVREMNAQAESVELDNQLKRFDVDTIRDIYLADGGYDYTQYHRSLLEKPRYENNNTFTDTLLKNHRNNREQIGMWVDDIDYRTHKWAYENGYLKYPYMGYNTDYLLKATDLDIRKSEKTLKELEVALKQFDVDLKELMREHPTLMHILSIASAFGFSGDQLLSIIGQFIPNFNFSKSTSRSSNVNYNIK